jgi:hypothetical protein
MEQEHMNYPSWICGDCGTKYGRKPCGIACWHMGVCGVCGKTTAVTEPRDYGHLKDEWKNEITSSIDSADTA